MQLWLVRHGQSTGNAASDAGPDPPLTDLGRAQAALAAERFAAQDLAALHCSPLRRALQTAEIIGRRLRLAPIVWPELLEKGATPILTRAQVGACFPSAVFPDDITEDAFPSLAGETEEQAYLRAERLGLRIAATHGDADISLLLVTHGSFGSIMIGGFVECPPCGFTRFGQHNCGISRLDLVEGRWRLRLLNAADHLPADSIT